MNLKKSKVIESAHLASIDDKEKDHGIVYRWKFW